MVISFSFHLPLLPVVSLTTSTNYFTPSEQGFQILMKVPDRTAQS
jgi:hypothetical protein